MLLVTSLNLMGISCAKISYIIKTFFGMNISPATANRITIRIAREFGPLYDRMVQEMRKQKTIHGDETSWPIRGKNHWLWTFVSRYLVLYEIDKSRGREVPKRVLGDYKGTIISDSWGAWNYVGKKHPRCHIHYLRSIDDILQYHNPGPRFVLFARTLKRILNDSHKPYADKNKLLSRIDRLIGKRYRDEYCRTMVKRLRRERDMLFTFIGRKMDWHNNTAERAIRSGVVLRKITYGSNSQKGAMAHRTLMSIHQTCRMNDTSFYDYSMDYFSGASKS